MPRFPKVKLVRRRCLGPKAKEHYFRSRGPHNRLCNDCQKATERVAPLLCESVGTGRSDPTAMRNVQGDS